MSDDFSSRPSRLLNKLTPEKTSKEKKQIRAVLLVLFLVTILLIGFSFGYRQLPKLWAKINESAVISQQFTPVVPSVTPTPKLEKEKQAVEAIIQPLRGKYGVYFQDLQTQDAFEINGKEKFIAASLIKMPVLITLYREAEAGRIKLDDVYKLQEADRRGGAGSLQYKPGGYEISFRKMAELMGQQSDNTSFHVLSTKLGDEKIQELIGSLGMINTSFTDDISSPEDMGLLFRKLYLEQIIYDQNRDEILTFLTNTIWEDRIPAGIPKGIKVSHKIGTEVGVIADAGIVFAQKPFILVIMSEEVNEIEAGKALPEIAKKIYELYEQ